MSKFFSQSSLWLASAAFLCFALISRVEAQTTFESSALDRSSPAGQGTAGGGANADFDTLITLIQEVVPGEWDTEDSITRFPSGVWVDADGMMHRQSKDQAAGVKFKPAKDSQVVLNQTLGELQKPQALRWISLNEIDRMLGDEKAIQRLSRPAGLMVGGLSHIQYLHWDATLKEWFIGGPAGGYQLNENGELYQTQTGLPPILLEDMLTVAPLVLTRSGAFGCTIDPHDEGLARANQVLQDPSMLELLKAKPKVFAERLGEAVGTQRLSLINLPEGCSTGAALLIADEHMKRVGLEQADQATKVTSYWQALAKQKSMSPNTMVRWWFALSEQPIAVLAGSLPGCLDYRLDRSTVRVQSQAEWMQANGKRIEQQARDEAADAFAQSFTENFDALQKEVLVYGRLRQIFDWSVVMEVIRREAESDPSKALLQLAAWDNQRYRKEPLGEIDSLVAVKKVNNNSISAVVSGGALIEVIKADLRRSQSGGNTQTQFHQERVFSVR